MFTSYSLCRQHSANGVKLILRMFVDCAHKDAAVSLTVNGRLQPETWSNPRWFEVETPEKAEAWFRKISLDDLAVAYRHAA